MKKLFALVGVVALVFSVCGCGEAEEPVSKTPPGVGMAPEGSLAGAAGPGGAPKSAGENKPATK